MRPYSLLPYAAIASVYAVLLLQAHRTERTDAALSAGTDQTGGDMSREPLVELVVGAIVVTAIVAARQLAAQKQNAELVAQRLEREAHFRALVQHASDVILVVDPEGRVLEASPAVSRVLGLVPEHLVGRPLYELVIPEDQALARADITQLASTPRAGTQLPAAPCEWRVRKGSAEVRWLEVLCTNLLDDPSVLGIVVNGRDVTERKALEAELSQLAFHDPLTGLCNRARFHAEVMDALSHGKPAAESAAVRNAVAILFIDLDGFKLVNDRHGHAIGDQVLLVVAERLRAATRGTDTVARLGGDEFAVLLGRLADPADVEIVAHRIVSSVGEPIDIGARDVTVGASVGIASLAPYIGTRLGASLDASLGQTAVRLSTTEAQFAAEALLRAADQAMYTAKRRGGHCYAFSGARSAA
jgi:diguanylate cyclase (GGDEF)-like protein/PAS domain S-box-containing protein